MRSRSVDLPTHIPIASTATAKPRAKSVYKAQVKGKGDSKKKLGKTAIVISSDSEVSSRRSRFPTFSPKSTSSIFQLRSQNNQINP